MMVDVVLDARVAERALKRDRYCCASCELTAEETLLFVVWSKDEMQAKDYVLKNALTLCGECRVEPARFRLPPKYSDLPLSIEDISDHIWQKDLYLKLFKKEQSERRKMAKRILDGLHKGHKWRDDQVVSVLDFSARLSFESAQKATGITLSKIAYETPDEKFRYFCKICWNWIKGT